MGISSRNLNSIQLTKATQQAIQSKKGLAALIQKVLGDGSDPMESNSFIRDQLAFYVKTALTLSNIMKSDSKLPIHVKLAGENSYVNLDSAFENGIEIGVAHKRPKPGEKSIEERLVCQYGYLEHEISHLRFANPKIWSDMLRFIGASPEGGRATADPNVYDMDNLALIKTLVNIIGDGHDETRFMMQNRRQFLKTIVAKDEIIGNYKFDAKKNMEEAQKQGSDGQVDQIIGNMLMHVLPNKATYQVDDQFMDDKAKRVFDEIIPHLDKGVEGTYDDIFEQSKEIYLILQREGYLPKNNKQQQQMQQFLQQMAQNNPDVFQQKLQQGQQAGGGQGGQGQGVGGGSGMTIQLPGSRSGELPSEGGDGQGNEKGKEKGQGSGGGEKGDEKGNEKGQGSGGKEQGQGNEKGDGKGKGKGEKGEGEGEGQGEGEGDGQGQSGGQPQVVTSGASGQGHNYNTPGGVGGPGMGSQARFVGKEEAERARQDAISSQKTNANSAQKQMQQLAQNNVENTEMKKYSTVSVETPRVTVEHLRKNLDLVRDSNTEIQKMKKLLKERLKLGSAPKDVNRQRFGRLDRRGFVRADETESELIFQRKLHLPSPKARIYMIGDMSGSMGNDQIYAQAKAMTISAEASKSLGIPIEVSYYSGAGYGTGVYMAKTFNQKNGIISLGADRGTIPGGGTPTAQAIDSACKRMVEDGFTTQEEQKIFYVMTDGAPDNAVAVKNKIEEMGKKYKGRVKVVGVFMKTYRNDNPPASFFQSFDTPYSEAVVVDGIEKVPEDFTRVLVDIMKKRKFK